MPTKIFKIRCIQRTKNLSDIDDREYLPAGPNGIGSSVVYNIYAKDEENAMDVFHETVPIGCLEDFRIVIERLRAVPAKLKTNKKIKRIRSIW